MHVRRAAYGTWNLRFRVARDQVLGRAGSLVCRGPVGNCGAWGEGVGIKTVRSLTPGERQSQLSRGSRNPVDPPSNRQGEAGRQE